jgi:hypothetical protein
MAQRAQQQQQQTSTKQQHGQPKRTDLIFHLFKTGRLVAAVLGDRRVHILRKIAYLGSVGLLLAILLFPEALAEIATAITVVFPILEIPADASIDWVAFAVATFSLLKFFPKEIVGEHYDRLFRR